MNARRTLLKAAAALPWRDRWRCTAWLWQTGRGHRLQALLNTSLGVASVLTALLFVWATKLTVDIATHADHRLTLTQALALLSGLALVEILLGVASRWVRALLGVKAQNALRATLFAHLLRCEWQGLKAYHSGDLLNRLEKDASAVVTYLTESLPQLVTTLVQFAGAFLFLFALDRALALLVVALLPVVFVVSRLYVRRMKALTHRIRTTESTIQSLVQESPRYQDTGTQSRRLGPPRRPPGRITPRGARTYALRHNLVHRDERRFRRRLPAHVRLGRSLPRRGCHHLRRPDGLHPARRTDTRPCTQPDPLRSGHSRLHAA